MALPGAALDDLGDLSGCETQLVVRIEEVRAEANAGVGPKVADDLARGELAVDGFGLRGADDHRAATAIGVARAQHLETDRLEQPDESSVCSIERPRMRSTPTSSISSYPAVAA